ncbi:tetraacyldisaccharide 4'-kinase [Tamlana nanhaiensis]|uniref:Tetraacyldisaccharide 4'-kinase n=1 Tax=Neotamlana nanhaiensis TaxID=1382798 RepID=A0A0D7W6T1_9FLAO|nr:tetraacyldisaccharide 4'-kinase [Tamlana nanhaiensis]KJD33537.1 tetraacyldisaccharide 4'-kinase [Tamlana nanhaiensis]
MKILRYILFPVVPVYYVITWVRNKLYDNGFKESKKYDIPVICVGNLSVGGTGKTPMIEYLINILKSDFKVATLSRGYKRTTKGFQLAEASSTAKSIGDEPFQFYNKFKNDIAVAVDSNRQNGIETLLNLINKPEVVLLDDAYQHRKVKAGFNVLLTTYKKPYFKDIVLPTGDLREPKSGAKRANVIIVTKCPETLLETDKKELIKSIKPIGKQEVFFSKIVYSETVFSETENKLVTQLPQFTLVTGIANATPLVAYLKQKHLQFEHLNFPDHYNFNTKDLEDLETKALIITTEKDFMRLSHYKKLKHKLFYLPITVKLDRSEAFNKLIKAFVKH